MRPGRRYWLLPLVAALMLWAAALGRDALDAWIEATELPPLALETSPELRDREGRLLRAFTVGEGRWRLATRLEGVDPGYLAMLIAYEDRRFWQHRGVDWRALARAAVQAVMARRIVSGGSTLTMQLARLLEEGPTGSLAGKLRQMRVALALERRVPKREILELYLNLAPFGGNLEGVRAASLAWFGKEPARLTPAEAALLVALPQSPERRRPDRHAAAARAARDRVLAGMQAAGVIDAGTAAAARREPVPTHRRPFPALAPHFTERLVAEHPEARLHRTTLDAGLQARLEALAARAAREAGERLSVAIMVADHRTGEILASVGSAGYTNAARQGYVDMTRALRSPGSTLKPLVYGLAFDQGLAHPDTLIEDRPVAFGVYAPENFDGRFHGTLRLRDALIQSLNIPAVMLAEAVTPTRLVAHLRRAGVEPAIPGGRPGLAVVLGGVGVSLSDLVTLYAGFGELGRAVRLSALPGEGGPREERFLSAPAAWQIGAILAQLPPPEGWAATGLSYKTGTSYGRRDAWAIGYDGAHVAGVWIGRADGTAVPGAFGAGLAAPVLFETFARLKPALEPLPPPPEGTLVSGATLPAPLRVFRARTAAFTAPADAPELAFPPDGARVETGGGPLVVKVRRGRPPFTWLANGAPVLTGARAREAVVEVPAPGFVTLSVIDAAGRADRVQVQLD